LFLLSDPGLKRLPNPPVLRMNSIFTTFISSWEVRDQQRAFVSYARAKQCSVRVSGCRVECEHPAGDTIVGEFDEDRLLVRLSSILKPTGPQGGGPQQPDR